jgi:hypothetical protein
MTNGWTMERRQRQAELIQRWKPWKLSTGARTEEGKEVSKMNAVKHGCYLAQARLEIKQLRRILNQDT